MKRNKGFTLIELVIVVAILALLVGLALPNFSSFREEAMNAKTGANLATIRLGVEAYLQNSSEAPSDLWRLTDEAFAMNALSKIPLDERRKVSKIAQQYGYARGTGVNLRSYVVWSLPDGTGTNLNGLNILVTSGAISSTTYTDAANNAGSLVIYTTNVAGPIGFTGYLGKFKSI